MTDTRTAALAEDLAELLRQPANLYLTTLMPDGSPQTTMTWADTDGERVLVNTLVHTQKHRNVLRDPRVSFAVSAPGDPMRYVAGRGRVVEVTEDEGGEHVDGLARRYVGVPFAQMGGEAGRRVVLHIAVDRLHGMG